MRIHTRTVLDIATGGVLADEGYEYAGPIASCGAGGGAKKQDFANSSSGQNISSTSQGNSSNLYGTLAPAMTAMATHPTGIDPADMAKMQTSNMQGAGGSNAGAVGMGSLLAARTKNAGTAASAIAKSGENASENLSKANLGTQMENQQVKQNQQNTGLSGLSSLYGTNMGQSIKGLDTSNTSLKNAADIDIANQQAMMQGVQIASKMMKPTP